MERSKQPRVEGLNECMSLAGVDQRQRVDHGGGETKWRAGGEEDELAGRVKLPYVRENRTPEPSAED